MSSYSGTYSLATTAPNHHSTRDAHTQQSSIGTWKQSVEGSPGKSFEVVKMTQETWNDLELQVAGETVLWSTLRRDGLQDPILRLRTDASNGPVVAGAKLAGKTTDLSVILGDPESGLENGLIPIKKEGPFKPKYTFAGVGMGEGRDFQWRKTHQKQLGSSRSASNDFKLVDPRDNDNIVAAYINGKQGGIFSVQARIDFWVDCGRDFELETIVTILGIAEQMRREESGMTGKKYGSGMSKGAVDYVGGGLL